MGEFFTWSTLGSMTGATSAVTLITQFIKWLSGRKLSGWTNRMISFIAALTVLYSAAYFTGTLSTQTAALTALNSIVVTLASNGLFDNLKSAKSLPNKNKAVEDEQA